MLGSRDASDMRGPTRNAYAHFDPGCNIGGSGGASGGGAKVVFNNGSGEKSNRGLSKLLSLLGCTFTKAGSETLRFRSARPRHRFIAMKKDFSASGTSI